MISTTKLSKILGVSGSFRLSQEDRAFLNDLAKVRIIDVKDADSFHYGERKNGARKRLDQLTKLGVLAVRDIAQPGRGQFRTYEFANERIAKAFGGGKAVIGSKRSALHEVITSKIYFAKDRPDSFIISSDFSKQDLQRFHGSVSDGATMPDAMYTDESGDLVLVEADSGNYTKSQVLAKQAGWQGVKQVWGQPSKASAKITGGSDVFRFS